MKLTFLGANRQVTGSRYCLESAGKNIMIDCGMVQEREHLSRNWANCPIPGQEFEALLLTHVHIDHSGLIPKLVRDGFDGPIYATPPSIDLIEIMLRDAARIQEEDAAYKKRRHQREGRRGKNTEVPLYTEKDVERALPMFRPVEYGKHLKINDAFAVVFQEAGHILGSASLEITATENQRIRKFVFSGDLGQWDQPMLNDPTTFDSADFVIMESTYGDRDHRDAGDIGEQLREIINRTVERGGNVVIPTFAVERAQQLMYHISRLVHQDQIPDIPVFLDSPMAVDVTEIYRQNAEYLDDEAKALMNSDEPPLRFGNLSLVSNVADSKAINTFRSPCIIMSASGMCNAGRIKHHLRNNIGRHESTIVFVGFQARGTLGRQILEGKKEVRIHGQNRRVKAEIAQIFGFSGHADRSELMRWLSSMKSPPRHVFLTHGEEVAALSLAAFIDEQLNWPVTIPAYGESFDLDQIHETADAIVPKSVLESKRPLIKADEKTIQLGGAIETTADFEFLNCPKIQTSEFIHQDPWRVLRIQSDVIQGVELMTRALEGSTRSVAVFGSARTDSSHEDYKLATATCRKLGEYGFAIITGGGPGIMEAANRGAREAATRSIALNISLPQEQQINPFVDFAYTCRYFFVRKMMFAKYAQAFVIFPGGFGTLDELFESLTLIQTGKLAEFPVILVGNSYWDPLVKWLRSETFHRGFIDHADTQRFVQLDSAEEVSDLLDKKVPLINGLQVRKPSLHK